jgi:hypothetical protein
VNHILIGLGGTGGNIIRCFRRLVYQEFRSNDPPDVNLGYLYVDSDYTLMDPNHQDWKVLGRSVQLPVASQIRIKGDSLEGRLNNLPAFPGIAPWIGDRALWKDVLNSVVGDMLGGQKRRLGRFLFACRIDQFRDQLGNVLADAIPAEATRQTTFHVLCGLAGGTGSGTVLDVVAQIRDRFPDPTEHRILVYALLPEQHPNPAWEKQNYHPNGYAALIELNALSVGAYHPWDLRGQKARLEANKTDFNGCYLISNENTNAIQVSVEHSIPQIVADFLFQKIIVSRTTIWAGLIRMENAENSDGLPESPGGNPERSKRFLGFGIKRIAIPEQEITEFLTYTFARQCLRQLAANHWTDSYGFSDDLLPFDAANYVQQPACEERWLLSDQHVLQEIPSLTSDDPQKRWKPFSDDWREFSAHAMSAIRQSDHTLWLAETTRMFGRRFDETFRNVGVTAFFRARQQSRGDLAANVRGVVERELFQEWVEGGRSIRQIRSIVYAIRKRFETRREKLETGVSGLQNALDNAQEGLTALEARASKVSWFGRVVSKKHQRILDEYVHASRTRYDIRTRIEATEFARLYISALMTAFEELQADVDGCQALLTSAHEDVEKLLNARIRDDSEIRSDKHHCTLLRSRRSQGSRPYARNQRGSPEGANNDVPHQAHRQDGWERKPADVQVVSRSDKH